MNKYVTLIIVGALMIGGGIVYRSFFIAESSKPVVTGKVREVTITAKENEWKFEPEIIEAERGDTIIATVINEDDYDHGIAIDGLAVRPVRRGDQGAAVPAAIRRERSSLFAPLLQGLPSGTHAGRRSATPVLTGAPQRSRVFARDFLVSSITLTMGTNDASI